MRCPQHGVVIARFPWARWDSGFTRAFEDRQAWLATNTSSSVVNELMRVALQTMGRILARTVEDASARVDLLAGVRRIGIDETSYEPCSPLPLGGRLSRYRPLVVGGGGAQSGDAAGLLR